MAHGLDDQTPIALIQQGTTPNQQVWVATLATLPQLLERIRPQPPTLAIVGGVVSQPDEQIGEHVDQGPGA